MRALTRVALARPTVTVLAVFLILAGGMSTYQSLAVELFPDVAFPLVTITTIYPAADPNTIVRDVTEPIEKALGNIDGLDSVQSVSSEGRSVILASFAFGTDMAKAADDISTKVTRIAYPNGVSTPIVGRIDPNSFPVLQLSFTGNREIFEIQEILQEFILADLRGIDGVFSVDVTGGVEAQVLVTVDPEKMTGAGISLFQVSQVLQENNVTIPAGSIGNQGNILPVKTTHTYRSIDDLRDLVVGSPKLEKNAQGGIVAITAPVKLADIATIELGPSMPTSISRTNGKPSIGVVIIKEPNANTIEVTTDIMAAINAQTNLPTDIDVVTISNDGPEIQAQIDTLEREAFIGLILATTVVFVFLLTLQPGPVTGMLATLRPTLVIGLSIPLSILTGVLLMSWQGLTLNFMTLGGLAISVGRVVDDSIVVLENIYRYIQTGREKWRAALEATVEVAPAITASTLTTIVVFIPLGFIQGLVGAFFFPFALTVSFALVASLLVALTAVPVLGAYLLKVPQIQDPLNHESKGADQSTRLQNIYIPMLRWALAHKATTLASAIAVTVAGLGLLTIIPVNLFPSGGERFVTIAMSLPPGTPAQSTLKEVDEIEGQVEEYSEVFTTTLGSGGGTTFGSRSPRGFNQSLTFVRLKEEAPENIARSLRTQILDIEGRVVNVREVEGGPPQSGLDVNITGSNYADISSVASQLLEALHDIGDVENITSNVTEAREEVVVTVDPKRAASIGLTTQTVAYQLNQFLLGRQVTQVNLDGSILNVVLAGRSSDANGIEMIRGLVVSGPSGQRPLSEIASIQIEEGPATISRTNGLRSASISGTITSDDTQAVGRRIQATIDGLDLPFGVQVNNGGVFRQIAEGFQDIFLAMAIGIALVYLVMVGSMGSLRNPLVIVTSFPLTLIGVMIALAVTGRSLGLPAMMGILLLIGIVVTNAIVLLSFVEQLRKKGLSVYEALIEGGRIRLRPILMTAITTSIALLPLATFVKDEGGIIGAELATVVIGGLASSTFLTLLVIPVVYTLANDSIPETIYRATHRRPSLFK